MSRVTPMTEPVATVAARLPPVPISENGTRLLSPWTTRTDSNGTPSVSAATWPSVVSWLWPCGAWLVKTVSVPSGSSRALARSGGTTNPMVGP